jgi:hypothetical protein
VTAGGGDRGAVERQDGAHHLAHRDAADGAADELGGADRRRAEPQRAVDTGSRQLPRFLAFLGSHVIPRQSVRLTRDTPAERRAYLERIQHEHGRIVAGISGEDPAEARSAMREHLTRSLERYRHLAGQAKGKNDGRG